MENRKISFIYWLIAGKCCERSLKNASRCFCSNWNLNTEIIVRPKKRIWLENFCSLHQCTNCCLDADWNRAKRYSTNMHSLRFSEMWKPKLKQQATLHLTFQINRINCFDWFSSLLAIIFHGFLKKACCLPNELFKSQTRLSCKLTSRFRSLLA